MAKVISEKEYDDLIAKLLVEGLNEEERVQVDEYQKALMDGKVKKSSPTEKRKDLYKNELKRRMGKDYDKKVLNAEDPRYAEGVDEHKDYMRLLQKDIESKLNVPFVKGNISTLGGESSYLFSVSRDKREDWENGYIENSDYAKFAVFEPGKIEMISGSLRPPMRKTRFKTNEDLIKKLEKYINSSKSFWKKESFKEFEQGTPHYELFNLVHAIRIGRKDLSDIAKRLDNLKVPFWKQNYVSALAKDRPDLGGNEIVNMIMNLKSPRDFDNKELRTRENRKEKLKSKIQRMKERYSLKEQVTPAFQKELFRLLRNHYPNATASDMEKVIKFIDRNCGKQND